VPVARMRASCYPVFGEKLARDWPEAFTYPLVPRLMIILIQFVPESLASRSRLAFLKPAVVCGGVRPSRHSRGLLPLWP
jgi:hypothetical protein